MKTLFKFTLAMIGFLAITQGAIAREITTISTQDGDVMVPLPQGYCDAANSAVGIAIKEHITYYLEQLEIAPEFAVFKKCQSFLRSSSNFGFVLIEDNSFKFHEQDKYNKFLKSTINKTDTTEKIRERSAEILKNDFSTQPTDPVSRKIIWTDGFSFIQEELNSPEETYRTIFSSATTFVTSDQRYKVATYFQYFEKTNQYKSTDIIREYSQLGKALKDLKNY